MLLPVFQVLSRWFAALSAAFFEEARGGYWHARRHVQIRRFCLFLLCLYLAVILLTRGTGRPA